MPCWAKTIATLAVLALAGGALVAWSGIVNVGASTGHWQITEWLLHFAMRQSVETHAPATALPMLDDPALVRRAAGHYAAGCAPCHGAPGLERSPVARAMTPEPPFLPAKIDEWDSRELFWIVRNGVKFTGMPAWPALQREDEVWAMVAFLRRLPALDEASYRALAFGNGAVAAGSHEDDRRPVHAVASSDLAAASTCGRCHGEAGDGSDAFPMLAGQSEEYLYAALQAYAQGKRFSGIMQTAASGLDQTALRDAAQHYARAEPAAAQHASTAAPEPIDATAKVAGERLALAGDPDRGIPACASCHGLAGGPRFAAYPRLAGQQEWYLAQQLRLLREGQRGGTPYVHIMRAVAERLTDAQIASAAAFYAALPAAR